MIPAAIALTIFSTAALATEREAGPVTVKVYGVLDVYAGHIESADASGSTLKLESGGMTTSYIGIGGSMPIAGDATAIFALESFLRLDDGDYGRYPGDELFGRHAYVGVDGGFGTLTAGRTTSPYFIPVVMFDSFFGDSAFSPQFAHTYSGNFGMIVGDSAWNNSILYSSPAVGGFTVSVAYAFGEEESRSSDRKIGANIMYHNGPLALSAAAFEADPLDNPGESGMLVRMTGIDQVGTQQAVMAAASYDIGIARLDGQAHRMTTETNRGDVDIDAYSLGTSIPAGKGVIMASYAHSDFSGGMDARRDTLSLGYNYFIDDSFDVYALLMHDDINVFGDATSAAVGARFRF